ncbi:Beta-glucosidase [Arcticibacter svalbardensis MN12-7]|uniref:Beta-glucosidase n=1 Tax=Arcticibacter svalbardensis MN12-7 TaxID=1150600 RepID=R9GWA4_9SPHI|nr:GH1 family beta-glucosidase [Arcticibacter svalbardensis]EOR95810.1 Beta-glucosidase [Arcticibacter svalbardensis MN12-7]
MNKELFGTDFKWGVSTAAFQIEGGCDAEGKGPSIWDIFSNIKGKIKDGHHANTACDFYNIYERDLDLVQHLHIPNFRFSLAWSRIMPTGLKPVNQKGLDYYDRVIDGCLERGIEPWPTLYHWDLPHALELKGGWTNRDVVNWFSDFTEVCAKQYGDRIKHWMVMNEPMVFTGAGYFLGLHAPGRTGLKNFFPAIHHAVLSMAEGGRVLRDLCPQAEIGTTFSCSHVEPYSQRAWDKSAANRADILFNRLFIEPILGLGYPDKELSLLKGIRKYMLPGDEDKMPFDFDFIGIQTYTREVIRFSLLTPYLHAKLVKAENRNVPLTSMKWEVYPEGIYPIIKKYNAYPQIKKIYITENGSAFPDAVVQGQVDDQERLAYLQTSLEQVLKAKNEGCKVEGYFVWTLTDNFEWAEGYHPRFGLVHVDFNSQERIIKSSGKWYAGFLKP